MNIDKITKQHVLDAVDKIEREGIVLEPSTRFDIVINGKAYPPKEIMRYANLLANGTIDWAYNGGVTIPVKPRHLFRIKLGHFFD
jgi:hypothetical protein